ncbi:MAG: hypothetical protein GX080_07195 [Tissierellia bacterium]|nr:hypothetical protein [Tissierellia bacterium]
MKNNLLYELHNDILKEEGYYKAYVFIVIFAFAITIEDIKPVIQVFRFILIIVPLVILVLVYIKFKDLRKKEEDLKIKRYMLFYALLTLATIVKFLRNLV